MNTVVFLIALTLFNEDRTGDLTSHWAIGNTVMNRVDIESMPNTVKLVLKQKNQFPWFKHKICTRLWRLADSVAWSVALDHAKLILASRSIVTHNFCYFQDKKLRMRWTRNLRAYKYGPHNYYECDGNPRHN